MSGEGNHDPWAPPDLSGRVAVVTGATRGIGRGMAEVLGACGATVYLTGRSTLDAPTTGNPEWTLERVAEAIERGGGVAVTVRCDHRSDEEVEALFSRVAKERGGLDLLVNNVVGWGDAPDTWDYVGKPLWQQPLAWWDANFLAGVRAHVAACRFGIPLLLQRENGLAVFTSELSSEDPAAVGDAVLDLRGHATSRLVAVLAEQLRPHGITALLLYPGWTRTEEILASVEAGTYPLAASRDELFEKTVSTHFSGRAVASLAADPRRLERSGTIVAAEELARELGFGDVRD